MEHVLRAAALEALWVPAQHIHQALAMTRAQSTASLARWGRHHLLTCQQHMPLLAELTCQQHMSPQEHIWPRLHPLMDQRLISGRLHPTAHLLRRLTLHRATLRLHMLRLAIQHQAIRLQAIQLQAMLRLHTQRLAIQTRQLLSAAQVMAVRLAAL